MLHFGAACMRRVVNAASNCAKRRLPGAILFALLSSVGTVDAQTAHAPAVSPMPMDDAARMLGQDSRLKNMSQHQRMGVLEFVAGNIVFVLQHEMGHAQISERALPVLGARDEDAADTFATLTMLKMRDVMSDQVLADAAMGWFLTAKRDEKNGSMLAFYDEHGLDKQRAFQVVCLMYGSDPAKFKRLADMSKLPQARRESCGPDYRNASFSWDALLKPHRRTADQPKTKVDVVYGEAKGKLKVYADAFRSMRLLETLANAAADEFTWKAPFTLEMKSCGESGAMWSPVTRKVELCYDMAVELADVYRKYGKGMKPSPAKRARKS
ncbi:MAG: DUF4344 domain-containing metallopeptidase [Variibacter sp.]